MVKKLRDGSRAELRRMEPGKYLLTWDDCAETLHIFQLGRRLWGWAWGSENRHGMTKGNAETLTAILDKFGWLDKCTWVKNASGTEILYDNAVYMMDDDIREELHSKLAPCTKQKFFTAYEKAHTEKFGEEWELSKENPTW